MLQEVISSFIRHIINTNNCIATQQQKPEIEILKTPFTIKLKTTKYLEINLAERSSLYESSNWYIRIPFH